MEIMNILPVPIEANAKTYPHDGEWLKRRRLNVGKRVRQQGR